MNINKKTAKGFSLVEILIVLAILAIMTGALFMTNNNKAKQEVRLAAREMTAQLRLLQDDMLNGKIIDGKIICKTEMYFDADENKYETRYYDDCLSASGDPLAYDFTPKKSKIDLGLVRKGSISFTAPLGKVEFDLGGPNGFLLQSEKDSNQKMTVCVNNAGNIEEITGENRYCAGAGCDIKNGTPCTMTNDCGSSNTGAFDCLGRCSVSAPPNPSFFHQSCDSPANNCGTKNHGVYDCNHNCSATRPPDSPPVSCSSTANSCGAVRWGTSVCGQQCSAVGDNSGCGTHLICDAGIVPVQWGGPTSGTIHAPFDFGANGGGGSLWGCGMGPLPFGYNCKMTCDKSKIYWNLCANWPDIFWYYCYNHCY